MKEIELKVNTSPVIFIKGARMHNLKNIDVEIPKNKLVVITGLSGSGKSSLAFDTLYAEGQRRYVESLSSYARQFMGRMNKPEVDYIKGIAPAIAIQQKVISSNPRSTVGTSTEIYDYLKLLFARIGKTYSPVSGEEVKRDSVSSVVNRILELSPDFPVEILSPVAPHKERTIKEELSILLQKGFKRVYYKNKAERIESLMDDPKFENSILGQKDDLKIVVDRVVLNPKDTQDEETLHRLADSVQTAFFEGKGDALVVHHGQEFLFSDRFEMDGIRFEEPSPALFSFNNPFGACKVCEGYGKVIGIDEDLVVPDKRKSLYEGAVVPWKGEKMKEWQEKFISGSSKYNFPIHKPYNELNPEQKALLWDGKGSLKGIRSFFAYLEEQSYKIQYRVMLSRYRGKTTCPDCHGTRLRKDASYVKISGYSIMDIVLLSLEKALVIFQNLPLNDFDGKIAKRLLDEIRNRMGFLTDVGLGYLTLNRLSSTLSGGESQRINLATSLGSSLVGSIYVLDEPSIGLHPKDTQRLIKVLLALKKVGNTVLVVEHEEEIMQAADYILDIGPLAGIHGGNLVFAGTYLEILTDPNSLTGKYLSGRESIPMPEIRRPWNNYLEVIGAQENNLKGFNVKFPLHVLTAVTGVSGSGKTSLVKRILYPALQKIIGNYTGEHSGLYDSLEGDYSSITQVELVDQNPIGRSSRSNPVTYVKAYDDIRNLFASQPLAKASGFKPTHFSFNVEGGRCDTCQGEGEVKIEMQFMADIFLPCEVCNGKRFKDPILEVTYREKNIAEVLEMSIEEALGFFESEPKILQKLKPLFDVGLGYVKLGQSSNTLSGGEAQRIKLAYFLVKGNNSGHTVFIFDEPTTGLHFHDIRKLLISFNALIAKGNTLIVIEHNLDVIKCADWVIDIGPVGGDEGGYLCFEGTPENMMKSEKSQTGLFLKQRLENYS
jgi:excinuclease ABC subunit A